MIHHGDYLDIIPYSTDTSDTTKNDRKLRFNHSTGQIEVKSIKQLTVDTTASITGNLSANANVDITGDLTITKNGFKMGSNTDGHIVVADGTKFKHVAMSGDISITKTGNTTMKNVLKNKHFIWISSAARALANGLL